MKIDKSNPKHWLYLALSLTWALLAVLLRPLRNRKHKTVVLYGHKYNGNLKYFAEYYAKNPDPRIKIYFLTLDPDYYKTLKKSEISVRALLMTRVSDMIKVGTADVIMTDHGLHTLTVLEKFTDVKLIDVWHGIPYKGWADGGLDFLKVYDEVWVSSEWLKDVYVRRYGFDAKKVLALGYARADMLVTGNYSKEKLRLKYGIEPKFNKVVLVAPTWKQDDKKRDIFPFGTTSKQFFGALNKLGKELNALIIFRAHLNVNGATTYKSLSNVRNMPYALYPDAEEFDALADVFITDWSSMAFEFLTTRRPAIFLDVPIPFAGGLIIGAKYRFGDVVGSMSELLNSIKAACRQPKKYVEKHARIMHETAKIAYGGTDDGKAAERYYARLKKVLRLE